MSAEVLRRAQSAGDLTMVRTALMHGLRAVKGGVGGALVEEVRITSTSLKAASRYSRECRDELSSERKEAGTIRLAVHSAGRLDLGPRLWHDPWLHQGRERLRADRKRFQASLAESQGDGLATQEERRHDLQHWLQGHGGVSAHHHCGAANFGPDAPELCATCGGSATAAHVLSILLRLARAGRQRAGTAATGSRGAACEGAGCGCHAGQWHVVRPAVIEPAPPRPEPPTPEPFLPDLETLSFRELCLLCESQGDFRWRRKLPPTPELRRRLEELCRKEGVATTGSLTCILQRLSWKIATVGNGADGIMAVDSAAICVF